MEFFTLIILFILVGILERFLRGAKKGSTTESQAPPEGEWEPESRGTAEGLPAELQDLIAEELGINLERRPRVRERPGPAAPPAPGGEGTAVHPGRRELETGIPDTTPKVVLPRPGEVQRGRSSASERREAATRRRREAVARPRPGSAVERRPIRETSVRERGEAVSLERPRRPEDHERFHERYDLQEPTESHTEFHDRYMTKKARRAQRRRELQLPEGRDWGPAQKAIVWAEILGPPKGLE